MKGYARRFLSPVPPITIRWDWRYENYCLLGFAHLARLLVIVVLVGIWKDNEERCKHIYSMATMEFDRNVFEHL
jgi:hypothetical protein